MSKRILSYNAIYLFRRIVQFKGDPLWFSCGRYTGRFIFFSVITNYYNKKTKGSILMELFTSTGKLKNVFLTTRDIRRVHHGWHGTHRYDIQVLASIASTCVHQYPSLLQWSVPLGQRGHVAMLGRILTCLKKKTRVLLFSYNKFLESRSTLRNALYNNIHSGAKIALKYTQHVHYRR